MPWQFLRGAIQASAEAPGACHRGDQRVGLRKPGLGAAEGDQASVRLACIGTAGPAADRRLLVFTPTVPSAASTHAGSRFDTNRANSSTVKNRSDRNAIGPSRRRGRGHPPLACGVRNDVRMTSMPSLWNTSSNPVAERLVANGINKGLQCCPCLARVIGDVLSRVESATLTTTIVPGEQRVDRPSSHAVLERSTRRARRRSAGLWSRRTPGYRSA
jgi:hypothetical protein